MAQPPAMDLLVIGGGPAGLAAAACAARLGETVALIQTGGEAAEGASAPAPPNFLWRLLELHRYEFDMKPVSARTLLLEDGERLATFPDAARTTRALGDRDERLLHQWPEFLTNLRRLRTDRKKARTRRKNGVLSQAREIAPTSSSSFDVFASANSVLDDWFADEAFKTHLICTYLAPLGLAGDEPGSAEALLAASGGAWPHRIGEGAGLSEILERAARAHGVDMPAARLVAMKRGGDRSWIAELDDGASISARRVIVSSALVADAAGLRATAEGSPLRRTQGAAATIRLRVSNDPTAGDEDAVFQIAVDRAAIIRARNSMLEGVFDENAPISFEIQGKDVVVQAPLCPARLKENGGFREWTGQDKQVLGRMAAAMVKRRMPSIGDIHSIDVTVGADPASGMRRRNFDLAPLSAPGPALDAVGVAAAFAVRLVRRE